MYISNVMYKIHSKAQSLLSEHININNRSYINKMKIENDDDDGGHREEKRRPGKRMSRERGGDDDDDRGKP